MKPSHISRADLGDLAFVGHGLSRPECAVAHSSGLIFTPDWTDDGGISVIYPNGDVKRHLAKNWSDIARKFELDEPLRPNGICLLEEGSFLLAHLGSERGGVFHLTPDGVVSPHLCEIDGDPLPPTNFVTVDAENRTWVTVSTRRLPRALAYRSDVADGFIAVIVDGAANIVADNLGYTNECVPHPDGKRLFVNETFARRLTSFDIGPNGSLTNRKTVAELGEGTFPDGLAFDQRGDAWLTSIVSNRVLRVTDAGDVEAFLEDVDAQHLETVEQAWKTHTMGRPHLDKSAGHLLKNISNLAFCGDELDHGVLGCLLGGQLATMKMPVRGHRPHHWTFDIEPLTQALMQMPKIK